ncbi:DUF6086 family protein [Streptomyces cyaneofuscatus]|uniref:DUF6086 family protein n=1 Tax=Streptomyces cyaneofuscatus TaxID=66883 RepID=UPI00343C50F1
MRAPKRTASREAAGPVGDWSGGRRRVTPGSLGGGRGPRRDPQADEGSVTIGAIGAIGGLRGSIGCPDRIQRGRAALSDGFLATVLALAERGGVEVEWPLDAAAEGGWRAGLRQQARELHRHMAG